MKDISPPNAWAINRIPPSTSSNRHSFAEDDGRKPKRDRSTASKDGRETKRNRFDQQLDTAGDKPQPMDLEVLFTKLDPTDPVHARRIFQRRKDLSRGKNTVGYHVYVKKVPKEKRRPRCMDTPSTPDPTLDISAKRWQGLIRAW